MYNQISNLITTRSTKLEDGLEVNAGLEVRPTSYPASPLRQLLANMASMVQISMFVVLFAHDKVLPEGFRENKMFAFFGTFMMGQMVSSGLLKTEAFEIYLGKQLVWSSLKNERMPGLRDLVNGFKKAGITIQNER